MGTKRNPGAYDCYERAEADEPLFTLIARDPLAADLVRLWHQLRVKDGVAAAEVFAALMRKAKGLDAGDSGKISEALACARSMDAWRWNRFELSDRSGGVTLP